jgi:acyl carrier protein
MDQRNVMARLTVLFRDVFDDPALVISPTTTAADVAAWDSMSHVTLIVAAEQAFGIRFRTAEMDDLHDVGALAQLIGDKCAAAAPGP